MSVPAQIMLGLIIVGGLWAFLAISGEVSARLGARRFRDGGPKYERYVLRRLRRAFWDGVGSLALVPPRRRKP